MKILRVDMEKLETKLEDTPGEYDIIGNRGYIAEIMNKEVPPTCHPLSAHNKLIFATGPMANTGVPTAGRLSVGGKSPLTEGIKESNSGGIFAGHLVSNGIKAIVVEDKPADPDLYTLVVSEKESKLVSSPELKGCGNYDVHQKLRDRFGEDAAIASIGPAGEDMMLTASVFTSDIEGLPGAVCARGAMGSVMGSKGLKAIVITGRGNYKIPIKDKDRFKAALKKYFKVISEAPQTSEIYPKYGTSAAMDTFNQMGALPSMNWRSGSFEHIDQIGKEALYRTIRDRKGEGKTTHRCMPGCPVRCYNKYPDKNGQLIVSPLQYETMALMGSNLGMRDLDSIAYFNYLCNDVGVDTVELGVAIGIVMEKGLIQFGDAEKVIKIIEGIGSGDYLSRILASGSAVTGKVFGIERVPAIKGQGLPAHEPRAIKGMGVTLSMTPMGADHTTGVTFRQKIDHHKPDGQVDASLSAQLSTGGYDVLGICFFAATAVGYDPMLTADLVNAIYGTQYDGSLVNSLGKRVMLTEKAFNEAAGFTKAHDRVPDFFRNEKLPPFDFVYDVPEEEMDRFWEKVKNA